MKDPTRLTHRGRQPASDPARTEFVNPPLVRGSTVLHPTVADMRARMQRRNAGEDAEPVNYGIYGSPTHHAFYDAMTALEGGAQTWALPSGLAACAFAVLAYVRHGDHVLIPDSVYWPTRRFALQWLERYGITTTLYDPLADPADLQALLRPRTRVLVVESPGSHTFEMQDIPRLAGIAHAHGAVLVADNTWATPLYCKPLALGADVVVHAATKYIGGHSDLLMGTVTATAAAWPALREALHQFGQTTSPDDCWLALRGLRSLAARLPVHRATAERLIEWLLAQPEVERVLYPALPGDPGHVLWRRDMTGATGLFGVALRAGLPPHAVDTIADALELFGRGSSWGGYESLVLPSSLDRTVSAYPYRGRLFRLHAGLEDADDLVADLAQAFERLRAAQRA